MRDTPLTDLYPPEDASRSPPRSANWPAPNPGVVEIWRASWIDPSGRTRWINTRASASRPARTSPCILVVCEDVTTVKELSERFEHEATHDALTGLVNRREIDRRLRELAGGGEPLSLCIIDLDHFKRINDTHGHHAGDVVLVRTGAHALRADQPSRDVLGRTGGDEMLLLLAVARLPALEHGAGRRGDCGRRYTTSTRRHRPGLSVPETHAQQIADMHMKSSVRIFLFHPR